MLSHKRVLFVVTSTPTIGPARRAAGYEFSEVAHPALVFHDAGVHIDFASPEGGRPPEDGFDAADERSRVFRHSELFQQLARSLPLSDVDITQYDALFYPGGLGPMVDLLHHPISKQLIAKAWQAGKLVGAVCHGPAALLLVELENGQRLVSDKRLTAFSSAEEKGHSEHDVPFMLDVALASAGAQYTHAEPFAKHIVVDGRLITGQNPASAEGVARAMLEQLSRNSTHQTLGKTS